MNNNKILLTYIVPVYNGEKYISECVQSILNQTVKDFEIIIVNDGSEDRSLDVVNDIIKNDSRITLIDNQHMGVSYAKNSALQHAKGKYIQFVDCDDYILPDMSNLMIKEMEDSDSDLCICGIQRIDPTLNIEGDILLKTGNNFTALFPMPFFEHFAALWENYLMQSGCNKIYKAKIMKENKILFYTNFNKLEDSLFNICYLKACKKVTYIDTCFYKYIYRMNKSLTQVFHENEIDAIMLFYNYINDILSGCQLSVEEMKDISNCKQKQLSELFERMCQQKDSKRLIDDFNKKVNSCGIE